MNKYIVTKELITVPTFTYRQGTHNNNNFEENPIQVRYYHGGLIELSQEGMYDEDEKILISEKHLDALFKAIKKYLPEAKEHLNSK